MRWISSSSRTQHDAYSLHDPLRDGRNHVHPGRNRDAKAFEVYVEHFLAPSLSEDRSWYSTNSGRTGLGG
jgi:hypothetical protein